jgi:hypothetical protein
VKKRKRAEFWTWGWVYPDGSFSPEVFWSGIGGRRRFVHFREVVNRKKPKRKPADAGNEKP